MTRESLNRALRTFVITTLALFVPGLLGWLNDLTSWAQGQGTTPFPDGRGLAYLGVSATTAGVVAVVNALWNAGEDALGRGLLRDTTPVEEKVADALAVRDLAALDDPATGPLVNAEDPETPDPELGES